MFNLRLLFSIALVTTQSLILSSGGESIANKKESASENHALSVTRLPTDMQRIISTYLSEYNAYSQFYAEPDYSIIDISLSSCGRYLTTIAVNFKAIAERLYVTQLVFLPIIRTLTEKWDLHPHRGPAEIVTKFKESREFAEDMKKLTYHVYDFGTEAIAKNVQFRTTDLATKLYIDHSISKLGNSFCKMGYDLAETAIRSYLEHGQIDKIIVSPAIVMQLAKIALRAEHFQSVVDNISKIAPDILTSNFDRVETQKKRFLDLINLRNLPFFTQFSIVNMLNADTSTAITAQIRTKCVERLESKATGNYILTDHRIDSAQSISSNNRYIAWAYSNQTVHDVIPELTAKIDLSLAQAGYSVNGLAERLKAFDSTRKLESIYQFLENKDNAKSKSDTFDVVIYDAVLDKIDKKIAFNKKIDKLAISANKKYLATVIGPKLTIYDLNRDKIIYETRFAEDEIVLDIKFGHADDIVTMRMKNNQIKLIDLNTSQLTDLVKVMEKNNDAISQLVSGFKFNPISFSQNGKYLACLNTDNNKLVTLYQNQSYELQQSEENLKKLSAETDQAFNSYGKYQDETDISDMLNALRGYVINVAKYLRDGGIQEDLNN